MSFKLDGNIPPSVTARMIDRLYQKEGKDYSSPVDDNVARNVVGVAYGGRSLEMLTLLDSS